MADLLDPGAAASSLDPLSTVSTPDTSSIGTSKGAKKVTSKGREKTSSPLSSKKTANRALWERCHSESCADWKLDHVLAEFGMTTVDWKMLNIEVIPLADPWLINIRWNALGIRSHSRKVRKKIGWILMRIRSKCAPIGLWRRSSGQANVQSIALNTRRPVMPLSVGLKKSFSWTCSSFGSLANGKKPVAKASYPLGIVQGRCV